MTSSPNEPKKKRSFWKILFAVLAAFLAVALLLCGVLYWLYTHGRSTLFQGDKDISAPETLVEKVEDDGLTVEYQGARYRYNENTVSILCMGVDKLSIQQNKGYGKNGQADFLFLAVLDTKTGATSIIPLPRETMVDVNTISSGGIYAGVEKTQLCLAYAYGATGEESCTNVARSVSRLLYGVPVNAYIALDLNGMRAMADMVGGVPLTMPEDFKTNDYYYKKGQTVTLRGAAAEAYVRHRSDDVYGSTQRLQRQKSFLDAFMTQAKKQIKADFTKVTAYYVTAKPYIITDLDLSKAIFLASSALSGDTRQGLTYLTLNGETVRGENFVEFYPDRTSTYEAVLQAFYLKEDA